MSKRDHYASKCPKCGNVQGYATKDITQYQFKCYRCQHTKKVHSKTQGGFRVRTKGPFRSVEETPTNIREWKKRQDPEIKSRAKELNKELPHKRDYDNLSEMDNEPRFKTYTYKE